jgi:uncharacterized membrane protein
MQNISVPLKLSKFLLNVELVLLFFPAIMSLVMFVFSAMGLRHGIKYYFDALFGFTSLLAILSLTVLILKFVFADIRSVKRSYWAWTFIVIGVFFLGIQLSLVAFPSLKTSNSIFSYIGGEYLMLALYCLIPFLHLMAELLFRHEKNLPNAI